MSETDESLPKYLRIAEDIRGRIERGELGAGAEVESERELAVRWAVARPTAAKALNTLRQSGIVESRRGSGTYVAHRRSVVVRDDGPPGWVRGDGGVGAGVVVSHERPGRSITVVAAAIADMPAGVANVFGSSGQAIMRRVAITHDGAVELRTSWYPGEFRSRATCLLQPSPIRGGARRYLESVLGRPVGRRHERVCARTVADAEREHLGVQPDVPVLVRQTLCYDAAAVLGFTETVYPPGRWVPGCGGLTDGR